MTSPIIPNQTLQPWNRLHSKECVSIHACRSMMSPGKITGSERGCSWAAGLQWCDGRAGLMPPNRFNNTSYKPVVENRLATTESRWVTMSHLAVTVIKCSSVDTPAAVTHSSALEKSYFWRETCFFYLLKSKLTRCQLLCCLSHSWQRCTNTLDAMFVFGSQRVGCPTFWYRRSFCGSRCGSLRWGITLLDWAAGDTLQTTIQLSITPTDI